MRNGVSNLLSSVSQPPHEAPASAPIFRSTDPIARSIPNLLGSPPIFLLYPRLPPLSPPSLFPTNLSPALMTRLTPSRSVQGHWCRYSHPLAPDLPAFPPTRGCPPACLRDGVVKEGERFGVFGSATGATALLHRPPAWEPHIYKVTERPVIYSTTWSN